MPSLNPFKRFQKEEKRVSRSAERAQEAKEEKKQTFQEPSAPGKERGSGTIVPSRVLKVPRVTEKAVRLAERNRYVFEVYQGASKGQVADAVERVYGVDVVGVRTVSIPPKRVRLRRRRGTGVKQGVKKAIVQVKAGQKIEILPV